MHNIFLDPDTFTSVVILYLVDQYTIDVLDWDLETIALEVKDDFNTDINPAILDKIAVGQLLLKTNMFHKSLPDFIWDAAMIFYSIADYKDSTARYQQAANIIFDEQNRQSINNPRDWLIGHWTMIERRKNDFNDSICFDVYILAIDDYGNVDLVWGETPIKGEWNANNKTLKVYGNQIYILDHRVLGGGNQSYKGLAIKDDTANLLKYLRKSDSIVGKWTMTERRKAHDDTIQFDVNILSVDSNGNVDMIWGDERILGKWDQSKKTLTVYTNQDYIFDCGLLAGGGNANYSGVAVR